MVVALDQIRLLCDYAGALLWPHKRRTKTMENETADKYLIIFAQFYYQCGCQERIGQILNHNRPLCLRQRARLLYVLA